MDNAEYKQYLASRAWAKLREKVKNRANGKCERCKSASIECVHHLTYERVGREHLADLQGLCNACHKFLSAKSDDDPAEKADFYSFAELGEMIVDGVDDGLDETRFGFHAKNLEQFVSDMYLDAKTVCILAHMAGMIEEMRDYFCSIDEYTFNSFQASLQTCSILRDIKALLEKKDGE